MTTKKPTTTTISKTTTGVTEFVEHSTDMELTPMPLSARPYILESSEFDAFIHGKRTSAMREIEDLDAEIVRLQTEIDARLDRRQDLMAIVIRADAALTIDRLDRPSPQITDRATTT
jgi:hypothetical protein